MRKLLAKCLDAVGFWLLDLSERICPIDGPISPRALADLMEEQTGVSAVMLGRKEELVVPPWNPEGDDGR